MTDEFKKETLIILWQKFPLAGEEVLLKLARILWDLIPKIYNGNSNE